MKKFNKTRVLSLVLAVVMVVSMIPITGKAAGTNLSLVDAEGGEKHVYKVSEEGEPIERVYGNGLVFGDGEFYYLKDDVAYYAGVVQDEEGNYYYINSYLEGVMDCEYGIGAEKTNGLIPAGYYIVDKDGKIQVPEHEHEYEDEWVIQKDATCTEKGILVKKCTGCDEKQTEAIKATGHDFEWKIDKKATTSKDGSKSKHCVNCGEIDKNSVTKIYKASNIKLSTTSYTYNGKAKNPKLTIKDSKGNTISSKNYTITKPSGRKKVGKYTYKVKFKNEYSGTKSLTIKIKPGKTSISKLTKAKKAFTVKWKKKSTQVTGYQIQYSTSKTFKEKYTKKKTVSSYKTTSKKIKGLKAKKTYYVRVRTYKTVSGTKYYSSWSAVKKVKTK